MDVWQTTVEVALGPKRRMKGDAMRPAIVLAVMLVSGLAAMQAASADGFVIIHPTRVLPHPVQLAVRYHHVDIDVRDQVARVKIDQVFHNPNPYTLEGEYLFPVPDGAAVRDFVLYVDGEPVHAEAMDATRARRIYEDLVRESRDPALLEYAGRELFRARIYPLPPNGDRQVRLEYDHLIERQGGLYRLVYPLATERFSSRPLENAYVKIEIAADRPIRNAYCPSHDVEIDRLPGQRLRATWEESGTTPDRDLVLYYALAEGPMDIRVVPYRPERGEDGYFMLLASQGDDTDASGMPKDIVFIIDHSGSMQGDKLEQARDALEYCLRHLNQRDRFNIISFSSDVEAYANIPRQATRHEINEAVDFVRDIEAEGGTDIGAALRCALDGYFSARGPGYVIFLTDGMPTEGERDVSEILRMVAEENAGGTDVRIFPFGIGYDVNAVFLDQLALENSGAPTYVRPNEDLESKVTTFYAGIAEPVLTDLAIDVDGARLRLLEPAELPDLFRGGQLVLFGRYRSSGPVTFRLSGTSTEGEESYVVCVELPEHESDNSFVGRLWATRRVGSLLREIRIHGEEEELVDEVKSLGLQFGIATPYTSFLVDESEPDYLSYGDPYRPIRDRGHGARGAADQAPGSPGIRMQSLGGAIKSITPPSPAALSQATGQASFEASLRVSELASADREEANGEIRIIAGRSYRLTGEVWRDVAAPDDVHPRKIEVGSGEYFALLAAHPELGPVLALGTHVIFQVDGEWYETGLDEGRVR